MILRIHLKKHLPGNAAVLQALITEVMSDVLCEFNAPYMVFMDGTKNPGERGGLMDNTGDALLLEKIE